MRLDLENLPSDIDLLHRLVRDMATVVETRDDEIERLQRLIKQLQRRQFGRRSERLDPDQLALGLEDQDRGIWSSLWWARIQATLSLRAWSRITGSLSSRRIPSWHSSIYR